jgi:hypothetical protein
MGDIRMKTKTFAILWCTAYISFIALLAGCAGEAEYADTVGKGGYEVEYLFTYNGIEMYRFADAGHYRYFTNRGEVGYVNSKPNGKTTIYIPETIE